MRRFVPALNGSVFSTRVSTLRTKAALTFKNAYKFPFTHSLQYI